MCACVCVWCVAEKFRLIFIEKPKWIAPCCCCYPIFTDLSILKNALAKLLSWIWCITMHSKSSASSSSCLSLSLFELCSAKWLMFAHSFNEWIWVQCMKCARYVFDVLTKCIACIFHHCFHVPVEPLNWLTSEYIQHFQPLSLTEPKR